MSGKRVTPQITWDGVRDDELVALQRLTPRETEVLAAMADGFSYQKIADTTARHPAHAARYALRAGDH